MPACCRLTVWSAAAAVRGRGRVGSGTMRNATRSFDRDLENHAMDGKTAAAILMARLVRFDAELALPTVSIAEIAFGIQKIRSDQRADRLEQGLTEWRRRFADRMFGLTEEAAAAHGEIMGEGVRQGHAMSAPGAMIAAIARVNGGRPATRNLKDFEPTGLALVNPWDF